MVVLLVRLGYSFIKKSRKNKILVDWRYRVILFHNKTDYLLNSRVKLEQALKDEHLQYCKCTIIGPYYHLRITLFSLKIYLRFVQPYLSRKYLRWNTII